jgi:NO-binding membrane sensor protein with MHYT domain
MLQVFTCLTMEHDRRLVLLAATVCFLASAAAINLFHRAQLTTGRDRIVWLGLDAAAAGFGIWATHFIAMLAYEPGAGAGYNLPLTILSLFFAVLIMGAGLGLALRNFVPWTAILGGAVIGCGVAVMHYTGMLAKRSAGESSIDSAATVGPGCCGGGQLAGRAVFDSRANPSAMDLASIRVSTSG